MKRWVRGDSRRTEEEDRKAREARGREERGEERIREERNRRWPCSLREGGQLLLSPTLLFLHLVALKVTSHLLSLPFKY